MTSNCKKKYVSEIYIKNASGIHLRQKKFELHWFLHNPKLRCIGQSPNNNEGKIYHTTGPCGPLENPSDCITSLPSSSSPGGVESIKLNKLNAGSLDDRKDEIDTDNTERDVVPNKIAHIEEISQIRYSTAELKHSIDNLDEIIEMMRIDPKGTTVSDFAANFGREKTRQSYEFNSLQLNPTQSSFEDKDQEEEKEIRREVVKIIIQKKIEADASSRKMSSPSSALYQEI